MYFIRQLSVVLLLLVAPVVLSAEGPSHEVELHFFWSGSCPHCAEAQPFVTRLAVDYDWLRVHSHRLDGDRGNAALYVQMAEALGHTARAVPAFIFCDQLLVGFDHADAMGTVLRNRLLDCHAGRQGSDEPVSSLGTLPFVGDPLDSAVSLPLLTLVMAGLDAFNPCAFFVLLFLLSLLINARERRRMLLVGMVFVFCSGLVYFLFMAAWLNVFLLTGSLSFITTAAGLLALLIAVFNIKDFFRFGEGASLSLSETHKRQLFQRMRGLIHAEHMPTLLVGTLLLAVAANGYELLCTAGFPMVYTRVLTLQGLAPGEYALYLLFYNLIYVTPLLLIVLGFVYSMGRHKLSERRGRQLKLLSGLMMLGLGAVLLVEPALLSKPVTGAMLLLSSILIALLADRLRA